MTDPTPENPALPAREHVIDDLETLKVLADPLRLSIVEYLQAPSTVKDVAEKIDRPPTKLYYHFNLLEKHGIIQMVDTRIVSGIVEKHYQATAKTYRIAWGLLSPTNKEFDERLEVMLGGVFGSARDDARESIISGVVDTSEHAPKHRRLMLRQARSSLTAERADEFYGKLQALLDEYGFSDREMDDAPEKMLYRISLLLHPSSRDGKHKRPHQDGDAS